VAPKVFRISVAVKADEECELGESVTWKRKKIRAEKIRIIHSKDPGVLS
jgi:hypothetical protein